MGRNVDDIPWPKRQPKPKGKKKPGSGRGNRGTTVGMVLLFLGFPVGPLLWCIVFILHGYHLI